MNRQRNIAIKKVLSQVGVKNDLKGYLYIIYAINKCLDDRSKINRVVKGIYAEIAEENNDTTSKVERAIRHAIEVAWERGNAVAINKIFGYTISADKGKPTNSEFIAVVTDFVDMNYEDIVAGTYKF